MFCLQCGIEVPSDAKFCHSCGASLKADVALNVEVEIDSKSTDERKCQLFIGTKYPYYKGKWQHSFVGSGLSFNSGAFFLQGLWFAYRKMYRAAILFPKLDSQCYGIGLQS